MMIVKASEEPEGLVQTVIRLPRVDLDEFDAVAAARRTSRAALIRESMLDKIAQYKRTTQEVKA